MRLFRSLRRYALFPAGLAAVTATISPGVHLLLSVLMERRRVTWASEYPALLVGDPLLAVAVGIAAGVAGPDAVLDSPLLRAPLAPAVTAGALAFGAWQGRQEVRRGVFTPAQASSPTKLWHQFVVYPTLFVLVPGAVLAATRAAASPAASRWARAATALSWACVGGWAVLASDVVDRSRPGRRRVGHGSFDWQAHLPPRLHGTVGNLGTGDRGGGTGVPDHGIGGHRLSFPRTEVSARTSDSV